MLARISNGKSSKNLLCIKVAGLFMRHAWRCRMNIISTRTAPNISYKTYEGTLGGVKYFGELEKHYFWGNEVNLYEHHVNKFFTCFATRRQRSSNKASAC